MAEDVALIWLLQVFDQHAFQAHTCGDSHQSIKQNFSQNRLSHDLVAENTMCLQYDFPHFSQLTSELFFPTITH